MEESGCEGGAGLGVETCAEAQPRVDDNQSKHLMNWTLPRVDTES